MNFKSVFVVLMLLGSLGYTAKEECPCAMKDTVCHMKQHWTLKQNMRKLWSDHVIWTRQYIVSSVNGTADTNADVTRLMKNQEEIGNLLIPYYGKEAARALTKLLKEHIGIAAEVVKAATDNAKDNLKKADTKWHENANQMADFLSKANPYWMKKDLLSMLNRHLDLTTHEVTYRIEKDWNEDVENFDQIFDQAIAMADTLSDGIIKQFPKGK